MVKLQKRVLAYLLMVLLLSACAHITEQQKHEVLDARKSFFWKSLRWKSYESALSVIKFKNPARQAYVAKGLANITVTSYEEVATTSVGSEGDIQSTVLFDYIQDHTGRVLKIKHQAIWWYDESNKQWFLDADLPAFKVSG